MATMTKMPPVNLPDSISKTSGLADVRAGSPKPLGTQETGGGVNFAIFSRYASRVRLEFFGHPEDAVPARAIDFDSARNRSGDIWHIWVKGITSGQLYAYRVDGPYEPNKGHRFNFKKLLLDPFATAISHRPPWDFASALGYDPSSPGKDLTSSKLDNARTTPKCIFVNDTVDWAGDRPLRHPWSKTLIYETHLRGFTIHPSSGVDHPGTYRGLTERIPYLKSLGVTAVELMPVQEFNENSVTRRNPQTNQRLKNYWGYDPVAFFSPKASYSSSGGLGQQKLEFKEMIRAFHKAGMEVILDVVFNHTAEGNELGPTLCFRGMDNAIFYSLEDDKRHYQDFAGTGNAVNANNPVVREHIMSALRYWTVEMHVDGFRFDEASELDRDSTGKLLAKAPLLGRIAEDPILRDVKIIAEAWDAAGAYEVGRFSERRWASWNGRFRDDVRRFWRGDDGLLGLFAQRLCGSADIYSKSGKGPESSINFVTCHDGFTLNDLVSYREKHNEANAENNRDGINENFSENYGVEGATAEAGTESVRNRQVKNILLSLLISRGVPMLLGGDFVNAESFWLADFSLFLAIQATEGTADWTRWTPDLRTRQPNVLVRARKQLADGIRYHQFVQWQFSVHWNELRIYCNSKGVRLIGDIPLFLSHRSADVWAHPELFKLNGEGNPTVVAGVPPDDFSKTGQLWGLPVYNWEALEKQGYRWWIERLRTGLARFDVNRLDHFIGFVRTYEVSAQAKTAISGQYTQGGGTPFFETARKALGSLPFIADDLGAITPEVVALLDMLQIPGTRVLQFELGSMLKNDSNPPALLPEKSVVYTGTHDNDTTEGWYAKLPASQREVLQKKLGVDDREIVWAIIRQALASLADTVIVPAQDLLGLGTEARMNVPGIAKGNWGWRLQNGALTHEIAQELRSISIEDGRIGGFNSKPVVRCQEHDLRPQIAKRAYELYKRGGCQNGNTVQNWLLAEREIAMEAKT